jgi:hypothetical protein
MSVSMCSECGVRAGEPPRPRWPLWLWLLPWFAVAAMVVVMVGSVRSGLRVPSSHAVGGWPSGFVLPDWSPDRVQRAAADPSAALRLRREVMAAAEHIGWSIEPGAELHYGWQVPEPSVSTVGYGWPSAWVSLVDPAPVPAESRDVTLLGTRIWFFLESGQFIVELSTLAFFVAVALLGGWLVRALQRLVLRWLGCRCHDRATAWIARGVVAGLLGMMMLSPSPPQIPREYRFVNWKTWQRIPLGIQFEQLREGDDRVQAQALVDSIISSSGVTPPVDPAADRLAIAWVNQATGTYSYTMFDLHRTNVQIGTTRCDPPSSGRPSTRFGWPEWRQGWLIVPLGTVGYPSSATSVGIEPAGFGVWCLAAMVAFWAAASVRRVVQQRVIRRRKRLGQCATCGYTMTVAAA